LVGVLIFCGFQEIAGEANMIEMCIPGSGGNPASYSDIAF
jgi:hypothetical protein